MVYTFDPCDMDEFHLKKPNAFMGGLSNIQFQFLLKLLIFSKNMQEVERVKLSRHSLVSNKT